MATGTATKPVRRLAPLRRLLRSRFGIWRVMEWRNVLVMTPRSLPLRRLEDAEVRRLAATLPGPPTARTAVVISTYKRPELLVAAVRSVLAQTVTDFVVVVVDDGAGLPELPQDPRLTALSLSRNIGVAGVVRNVGIRLSRSQYLAFLDDDNTWRPDHLERALEALAEVDVVYTGVERRLADGTVVDVLSRPFDRKALAEEAFVDSSSIVARRSPAVLFSRLPRRGGVLPMEDWELVFRLSGRRRVRHVPHVTVNYLVDEGSYYSSWDSGEGGELRPRTS